MPSPERSNPINKKARIQIHDLCMTFKTQALSRCVAAQGDPALIKFSYSCHDGLRRLVSASVKNHIGQDMDLPLFSIKSLSFMIGPADTALDLAKNLLDLVDYERQGLDTESRCDIAIEVKSRDVKVMEYDAGGQAHASYFPAMRKAFNSEFSLEVPGRIAEIRDKAGTEARAVAEIIREAWQDNTHDDDSVPTTLVIKYEGHESQGWIEKVAIEDAQETAIAINEEVHYVLRDVIRSDPDRNAAQLIQHLTELSGHSGWLDNDGGFGEIKIDLATGEIGGITHNARYVEYNTYMYDRKELLGERPREEMQGPQPG